MAKTVARHPITRRLVRRVVIRTLAEVVPPVAISSVGHSMFLLGYGLEVVGKALQTSGSKVERFGFEQGQRTMTTWFPEPNPRVPAAHG